MKLTDLNPSWVIADVMKYFPTERRGMGITFDCPVHRNHSLAVMFSNPLDGLPPAQDEKLWSRTGDTFEELTITPSIDASKHGCWHGFITNGEVK